MQRFVLGVALIILFALQGCYLFQESQTFYGLETGGKGVVFLLDVSGSMEGKDEGSLKDQVTGAAVQGAGNAVGDAIGGPLGGIVSSQAKAEATKLGSAKRELIPAIQGLPDSSRFTLMTFGDGVGGWKTSLVDANSSNKTLAVAYLKNLESDGSTPAKAGLEAALRVAGVDMIFFVSDGRPTDGSRTQILDAVRQLNRDGQVRIYSVGLGDDQDEQFLAELAQQNGGQYMKK